MTKYQIENTISGVILGVYEASSPAEALDIMARDAGYSSYMDTPPETQPKEGEIVVTKLK
jgi:hypothetical protein